MRFAFIAKNRPVWPVAWLCDVLQVSRSGFHAWLNRSPSDRAVYDETLVLEIGKSRKRSDWTYGARRVWHDVLAEGLACGLHPVERPRRENDPPDHFLTLRSAVEWLAGQAKTAWVAQGHRRTLDHSRQCAGSGFLRRTAEPEVGG